MSELARELQETIEHLVDNEPVGTRHGSLIADLQAVAQTAMRYHYGSDGVRCFNRLSDARWDERETKGGAAE